MSRKAAREVVLIAAALALWCRPAEADRLTFRAGGVVDLPTTAEAGWIVVHAPEGDYRVDRRSLASLEPIEDPEARWPEIAGEATAPEGRLSAVRWALEHGLVAESVAMLRESGPNDATTSRMIAALDRLAEPRPDPELGGTRRALGGTFAASRGPHVLLLHQHDEEEASARLEFLEAIVTAYYLEFAALGFDLPAPETKLVAVWFADQQDYRAFLRREGAAAFLNTRGYHHPTRRLVAAYDARGEESYRRASRAIDALPSGAERDRRRMLLEESRRRLELGTAAHETVHQLVAASRLAPRGDAFPGWLHEGLAMQFEATRGDRWAGLGAPSPYRLADWRRLSPKPVLATLLDDSGFARGYRRDPYAHAWAFVHFLRTRHPDELVRLIDACRLPGGRDAAVDRLRGFDAELRETMRSVEH
jgi:hypothetical protein